MKTFHHLIIFSALHFPLLFAALWIGSFLNIQIVLYGLIVTAAICYLNCFEAVCGTLLIGFWLDAMQPFDALWGLQAFLLSIAAFSLYFSSWKNFFKCHLRLIACFLNVFLQTFYLLIVFCIRNVPLRYLSSYGISIMVSALLVVCLTVPLSKIQQRYFL